MNAHLEAKRTANMISILERVEVIDVRSKRRTRGTRDMARVLVILIRLDQGVHCRSRAEGKPGAFEWSRIPISKPNRIKEGRGAVEGGTSHPVGRGD